MDLPSTDIKQIISLGDCITQAVSKATNITHPETADLAFLLGTIFTDGPDTQTQTKNICVYGDKQVSTLYFTVYVHILISAS